MHDEKTRWRFCRRCVVAAVCAVRARRRRPAPNLLAVSSHGCWSQYTLLPAIFGIMIVNLEGIQMCVCAWLSLRWQRRAVPVGPAPL